MLNITNNSLQKTLEKLSSGKRINRASDDAAGLAISQKMDAQIRGLRQASRNGLDGISLIQTAEGALNEVHAMLQRMRELSVQGANGIYGSEDLEAIASELKELTEQIDKVARDTTFNGIHLLSGNLGGDVEEIEDNTGSEGMEDGDNNEEGITANGEKLRFHIGANEGEYIEIDMKEINIRVMGHDEEGKGLKIANNIIEADTEEGHFKVNKDNLDPNEFNKLIDIYDQAVKEVASHRSRLGAYQNRLEHTIKNLDNTAENLTAAKSRIEDVDMALEMSEFVKLSILQQSGTAMLYQANQLPQSVLQLLQ